VGINLDEIEANIDRGRAVLKAASSTMGALDQSAAVVQSVISARRDISSAVELWRVDGRQNSLPVDSLDRRREELRVWSQLAEQARSIATGGTGWAGAVQAVASSNPLGLAVTSAVTMFDDYLERRTHQLGYEKLGRSLDRGLVGIRDTLGAGLGGLDETMDSGLGRLDETMDSGLGRLDETMGKGLKRLDKTLGRGFADLSLALGSGLRELSRTMEAGFQQMSAEFSWGLSELLWRADQQNETVAEIRDVLTRPLDTASKELRIRAIRSYDNGWMDEALADFLDAMGKSRVDYVIAHYLGNIYLRREDYDAAADWFMKSARWSRPDEPRHAAVALMHQALACALRRTGEDSDNCREAIACLDEALNLDPTNIEALFQRAQFLARIGDSDQAVIALEDVVDHDGRYLVRILIERDFQDMGDQIADLIYWLTRSYSRTIERQLRQLAPFLRQVAEGIRVEDTDTVIDPYAGNEDIEAFVQAVTLATSLYSLGDFHSVQRAQVLLLALRYPERRTVRNRYLWVESRSAVGYGAAKGRHGSYRDFTYSFYGVGGDLV